MFCGRVKDLSALQEQRGCGSVCEHNSIPLPLCQFGQGTPHYNPRSLFNGKYKLNKGHSTQTNQPTDRPAKTTSRVAKPIQKQLPFFIERERLVLGTLSKVYRLFLLSDLKVSSYGVSAAEIVVGGVV